uniref:non-specific serine/threonine protein kinase n=1 Tax=Lates calcarifer TaxID=8187 RepID=A0A4W6G0I4_LATCA
MFVCVCPNFSHSSFNLFLSSFFLVSFSLSTLLTLALSSIITDGAPLSELSWPSSLAVVAVSFSGLFTFVFLMLACLCCKKGDIGFKEFENTEGEEYQADLSALASPSSQNGPEVYILPLTEVSLPVSKQPGRSIQLLKSSDLGRHSLLYLKEIGHGWFGKVLLGEVNAGLSTTQVVVKELKASASVQDQMQFLEEVQPYRTLQHPALLQCLAQCSEVTPYLLVMEFCPLGDLKSYLRSCRVADSETPDPLILQRMACDIASGLLHLHKYNFIHSDLALRNCLLTSEMSVKIGDYGLSQSRYKVRLTFDIIWVPLRWIAPELIDEVHGNLLVVDQTKSSNIWSLGVAVWELFELGNQPYRHYSDRQVLTYAVKEQQLKLPKPHLQFPMAERWYEVMQFCWLQPELRPSSEEVHLLVTYLCAKGSSEAEEDFEQRWNALRPNLLGSTSHTTVELASSASSSFPLLEHFSDSFHSDTGDDLLTVTETSHGLNFEYKWEQARAEQPYCASSTSGPLGQGNPHYQDIYYSSKGSTSGGCKTDSLTSGISPSYYEPEHPGVVPVLSAHSPSVSSEYYIRIEEPVECNINLDDSVVDYSPGLEASNSRLSSESRTALSQAVSSPSLGFCDPYLEASTVNESCHNVMGPLRKTLPIVNHISIDVGTDDGLLVGQRRGEDIEDDLFSEGDATNWTSNHSANNNSLSFDSRQTGSGHDSYLDLQYTAHSNTTELWSLTKATTRTFNSSTSPGTLEAEGGDNSCNAASEPTELSSYVHLCHKEREEAATQVERNVTAENLRNLDSCTGSSINSRGTEAGKTSESNRVLDSKMVVRESSIGLAELGDYSEDDDDDITDITSGIFADFNLDYAEVEEEELSPLKNPEGTPDSVDTLNLSSLMASPCDQAFSPDPFNTPILPKSLDSGYDTENNESPEFIFKELGDPRGGEMSPRLEVQLKGLTDKSPYRDSAYFSDYDAENERSPQEEGSKFFAGPTNHDFHAEKLSSIRDDDPIKRQFCNEEHLTNLRHIKSCVVVNLSQADPSSPHPLPTPGPPQSSVPPSPLNPPLLFRKPQLTRRRGTGEQKTNPIGPADLSTSSSLLELCGEDVRAPLEEAEDEDDSDDSESDEELRTYNIQDEDSEESEEDFTTVPVVVSDCSRARHLRSLLKMPTLLTQSFCDELERKKKAVSFFDDVTVFLFDQGHKRLHRVILVDLSQIVHQHCDCALLGGGYEWEDDLTFEPRPSSTDAIPEPESSPTITSNNPEAPKPAAVALNRFMVSRFSITHVSDPHVGSATGLYKCLSYTTLTVV